MSEKAGTAQLRIRLSEELKKQIEAGARYNKWSINAEFSHQLELSYRLGATVRQLERELAELREHPQPSAAPALALATGSSGRQFDENAIIEKLVEVAMDLRSVRQSVIMSEQTHREVDDLEELLSNDVVLFEKKLLVSDSEADVEDRDLKPTPMQSLPMLRNLMRQIDRRTTAIVNFALTRVGKHKDRDVLLRIEGSIAKDHALLPEDRYEGSQRLGVGREVQ